MRIIIVENAQQVAQRGAQIFSQQINNKPNSVIGLATGSTPISMYQKLIQKHQAKELSFAQVTSFNLDEYLGLKGQHPQSYRYFMNDNLFHHIDINLDKTHVPNGASDTPLTAGEEYEDLIQQAGGIDLQLLGIGRNGHIGFNEPTSSLNSRTRIKTLTQETIDDNARFFGPDEFQPTLSITMGIGTINQSRGVVLLATGDSKAQAIKDTVEGPLSAMCPASALQLHQNATIIVDEAAASLLAHKELYKHIESQQVALTSL